MSDIVREFVEVQALAGLDDFSFAPDSTNAAEKKALQASIGNGYLIPVVGAGASDASGLPQWRQLVEDAISAAFKDTAYAELAQLIDKGLTLTTAVRATETILASKIAFRSFLIRELYKKLDISRPNTTLEGLCDLIVGNSNFPTIKEVITFNFDDLLERKLRQLIQDRSLGLEVVPIHSEKSYRALTPSNAIKIYHVHGFLPSTMEWEEIGTNKVVFSEPDYHDAYFDQTFWANAIQRHAYSTRNCLFVGLSMTDPNLRRLLDQVVARDEPLRHHGFAKVIDSAATVDLNQLASYIRGADLNSLGISPIWISDYSQISIFLKSVILPL